MDDNANWKWLVSLPDAAIEDDRLLLAELDEWIRSGAVIVEKGSDLYFSLINARFPIGLNRVDWSRVENFRFHAVTPFEAQEHSWDERKGALDRSMGVIRGWLSDSSIRQEDRVVAVGDVSNVALHMSIDTLLHCCHVIFLSGQHVYVIPETADWCLNYTMENELWFGRATNSSETRETTGPVKGT